MERKAVRLMDCSSGYNPDKVYIGLSMSFCIKDILEERIPVEKVIAIIAGTNMESVDQAIRSYGDLYWANYEKDRVYNVLTGIWGRVIQPRQNKVKFLHTIATGHWIAVNGCSYGD